MFGFEIELSKSDLEGILLWYSRAFKKNAESTQADRNTLTKLQAMIIVEREGKDGELFSGSRRTRL